MSNVESFSESTAPIRDLIKRDMDKTPRVMVNELLWRAELKVWGGDA